MDAIYYNNGIIRPIVAVIKSLASAISIGSGGSVGREGPIIQIGASFGSTLGQVIRMPPWQRITLIAAGAGGGIAATFNTPVGGVLFAVELMLHEVSARTLIPVAISTATATYIGQLCFGPDPSFVIPYLERPYFHVDNPWLLLSFAVLGILLGFISTAYIKSIYAFEDFFEQRVKGNYYTRHMSAMFLVGVIMYVLLVRYGHYYTEGVGYATIQDVLTGQLSVFHILLLLFLLKLLVTSLTLGSGASGGIFSPSLFIGRHGRSGLWTCLDLVLSRHGKRRIGFCGGRDGGRGRRRHGRGDGRHCHDFRDDARLSRDHPHHHYRGVELWNPQGILPREHLYFEAQPARAPHSRGPPGQPQ